MPREAKRVLRPGSPLTNLEIFLHSRGLLALPRPLPRSLCAPALPSTEYTQLCRYPLALYSLAFPPVMTSRSDWYPLHHRPFLGLARALRDPSLLHSNGAPSRRASEPAGGFWGARAMPRQEKNASEKPKQVEKDGSHPCMRASVCVNVSQAQYRGPSPPSFSLLAVSPRSFASPRLAPQPPYASSLVSLLFCALRAPTSACCVVFFFFLFSPLFFFALFFLWFRLILPRLRVSLDSLSIDTFTLFWLRVPLPKRNYRTIIGIFNTFQFFFSFFFL